MIADEPLEVRNAGGRPKAEIDLETVKNAAKIGCTINEIAAVIGVSRSTMFKHMSENPEIQVAIDEGRDMGCGTLRRFQWQRAEAGSDTMCIWLGKQMLGQKDKSEVTGADDGPLRVAIEFVGAPAAVQQLEEAAASERAAPLNVEFVGR